MSFIRRKTRSTKLRMAESSGARGTGILVFDIEGMTATAPFSVTAMLHAALLSALSATMAGGGISRSRDVVKRFTIMGLHAGHIDPQGPPKIIYSGVNLTAATAA